MPVRQVITKTEAIKAFLTAKADPTLSCLYDAAMEVQVNVDPEGGDAVEGTTEDGRRWKGYKDPTTGELWKELRVPWSNFEFVDSPMTYDLARHAQCIGLTGWDWQAKVSRWVGFDFDSLVGHQKGLTDEELAAVAERCTQVPWVTVRRSKSGKGLHLYVFIGEPEATESREEHGAVARAVLNHLSAVTGMDLIASVDGAERCNLWIWHKETKPGGLTLVKQGEELPVVPTNWRNHLPVVRGQAARAVCPLGGDVEELVGKQRLVGLDAEHRRLLNWFGSQPAEWWWDGDRHMLVCHTADLKKAHVELGLKGVFYTSAASAAGSGYQNCFAFPLRHGAWTVRRHGKGTQEHRAWTRDSAGWTRCSYNKPAELHAVSAANDGTESAKGEFHFSTGQQALAALKDLGVTAVPEVPLLLLHRPATISEHDRGRLVLRLKRETADNVLPGWLPSPNGKLWETLLSPASVGGGDLEPPDELVRHVVTAGADAGWFVHARGSWVHEPRQNVTALLIANGVARPEVEPTLGTAIQAFWELINVPFGPEYPGNRRWNKFAAKLAFVPREGPFPTWTAILRHVGHSLTEPLRADEWAKKHGVNSGLDYLLHWCAAMLQEPLEPLPYLFLYGPQNSGKSIFHEALGMLLTSGYVRVDTALTNPGRFNGELAGAVLCAVEETNLRAHKMAGDRIKDWVTGKTIQIHVKGRTPYDLPNSCHFVQCANPVDHCPIMPGDTRITAIHVSKLESEVPKRELLPILRAEAPAFLYALRRLELPPPGGRLRIPIVSTIDKTEQMQANQSELETFMEACTFPIPGAMVSFKLFSERFMEHLRPEVRVFWTARRIVSELQNLGIAKGRYGAGGQIHVGNVSFEPDLEPGRPWTKVGDRLVQ